MVNKFRKSIADSRRKRNFNKNQTSKKIRKQRDSNEEKNKFVDKRQMLADKKAEKKAKKLEKKK